MSTPAVATIDTNHAGIPLGRLIKVELRKMFDTRSGFWLMASIAILALIATASVIAFFPDDDLSFSVFALAVGFPMAILLPVIAILSVTGEWSQRTGLITFTLVPNRGQVILAKGLASILVGVVSIPLAFAIGALGNVLGATLNGIDIVWDFGIDQMALIMVGNVLGLLIGFMLGVLIRNTPGAIVGYFVYSFVLPSIFQALAALAEWFKDLQPWVDFGYSQTPLFDGEGVGGEELAQLATSGVLWLVLPLAFGVWRVLRAEVK